MDNTIIELEIRYSILKDVVNNLYNRANQAIERSSELRNKVQEIEDEIADRADRISAFENLYDSLHRAVGDLMKVQTDAICTSGRVDKLSSDADSYVPISVFNLFRITSTYDTARKVGRIAGWASMIHKSIRTELEPSLDRESKELSRIARHVYWYTRRTLEEEELSLKADTSIDAEEFLNSLLLSDVRRWTKDNGSVTVDINKESYEIVSVNSRGYDFVALRKKPSGEQVAIIHRSIYASPLSAFYCYSGNVKNNRYTKESCSDLSKAIKQETKRRELIDNALKTLQDSRKKGKTAV